MQEISHTASRAAGANVGAASGETPPAREQATGARAGDVDACFHCGSSCPREPLARDGKSFCCRGCLTVFELLTENGLAGFYELGQTAGVRVDAATTAEQFLFLDEAAVRERLVDFADARTTRVTFRAPAIHCLACVWLLENLFRLQPGIGRSRVNFLRQEVAITFATGEVKLSQVVALLASLGYEPDLKLSDLRGKSSNPRAARRLWLQLGIAGFAFGNTMLFSLSSYLGLSELNGPGFRHLFGLFSLALTIPVVLYSALDYWRSAWVSLRRRLLNIDVPITAGVLALFAESAFEVVARRGEGYFDTLSGLIFFLLVGKLFQRKTYDWLAFDRDYQSFFPLSVTRRRGAIDETVSLSGLAVGDRLIIRNAELIPADARLIEGPALADYSFVTGESEPVPKQPGDHLYAGGRQMGAAIEVEIVKPVSQSYLASLWSQEAFRKEKGNSFPALTNQYSQRFTKIVMAIAVGAAMFWAWVNPALSLKAFTSVLIVACPCALALAAPFALGTAQRLLARRHVVLKHAGVIETLARVDSIVFDKTGTLTAPGVVQFFGAPLAETEQSRLGALVGHSTHPLAARIHHFLGRQRRGADVVRSYRETPGGGLEGNVDGQDVWLGSWAWLKAKGAALPAEPPTAGGATHAAFNRRYRGTFMLATSLRPEVDTLINRLGDRFELALLSGDNERERDRFAAVFPADAALRFNQSPLDKLEFIRGRQRAGRVVMMVGDGLNDAGALRQSDVGVAVVETPRAFSPASDVILQAEMAPRLDEVLRFAKATTRVVRASFLISAAYNLVGVTIAARGLLSPVICAVLMPLSSATVVAFTCGATVWLGRRLGSAAGTITAPSAAVERPSAAALVPQPVQEVAV